MMDRNETTDTFVLLVQRAEKAEARVKDLLEVIRKLGSFDMDTGAKIDLCHDTLKKGHG